ncbi:MAG: HDIG domain-containing protein [Chloroflexia bacterium]|nr:HDIG domain-containing protein [Chloroflexia bacterium]
MPRSEKRRRTSISPRLFWRFLLFALVTSLLLGAILVVPFLPGEIVPEVQVGAVAPTDVKSPITTRYVSQILTRRDQEAAAAEVADVYRFDPSITLRQRQALSDTLQVIESILFDPERNRDERQESIATLEEVRLSRETLNLLLILQKSEWQALKKEALHLYDEITQGEDEGEQVRQIREQSLEELRLGLEGAVRHTFYPLKRTLIADLVSPFLVPNYVVDEEETEQRREQARSRTPPHYVEVLEGELILAEGQIVQDTDLEKLEAVGLRSREGSWLDVWGQVVLVVGLVGTYGLFLLRFQPRLFENVRWMFLLGLIIVLAMGAAKFVVPGRFGFAYAFPLTTAALLLTLLLNPQIALGGTVVLSILVGLLGGSSLELAVLGFVGGTVGILSIWKAQRSTAFLFSGFYVTLAQLWVAGAFRLIYQDQDVQGLLTIALACGIHGFSSAALSFASFGFLGNLFGQVTVMQLFELANPAHPLLRRLMREAPGTYYHSIVVGNLAERAAEVIGADPLLVRVGAYFHDVGKVVRPYFFVDNQAGRLNIHDELNPRTSAQLITDHVRDGIVLARKYRLPERLVQFIPEHHGTTLATYFYRRALQEDETVDPEDFRYPGPKPQSRETAILMLADSVEAAVRSMDQSGKLGELLESASEEEDALDNLVGEIIDKKVRDGQLDDCDLTFRDLRDIRRAFVSMLRGVYHPRISYPELEGAREKS